MTYRVLHMITADKRKPGSIDECLYTYEYATYAEFADFCKVFCGGGFSHESENKTQAMIAMLKRGDYVGAGPTRQYFKLEMGTDNDN